MQATSAKEARELGLKWYFTGKECPHGHAAERSVKTGNCRTCQNAYAKEWRKRFPEKQTVINRRHRAKNRDVLNARMRAKRRKRDGIPEPSRPAPPVCEICRSRPKRGYLCVDHSHATGLFRGWLCSNCNLGIGNMAESEDILRAAIEYLRRFRYSWKSP